jgi:hypothetical protein
MFHFLVSEKGVISIVVIKQTQIAKVIYLTVVSNNKYTTFDTDFKNAFNYRS